MRSVETGALLRAAPKRDEWSGSRMGRFLAAVEQKTGRTFAGYEDAWQWSVDNLEEFWAEVWDHFEIISHTPYEAVLGEPQDAGGGVVPGFHDQLHRTHSACSPQPPGRHHG